MAELAVVRPRYGQASLADILPSVLAVLGVPGERDVLGLGERLEGVRRVAVLLCDGMGWHQLAPAARQAPTLADIVAGRLGSARQLTCGFPSTTPVSLTTLGTGVAPGAHGIIGFNLNVPGTARVLNHLRWEADPDPMLWQPVPTAFERAAAAGVPTTVVSNPAFATGGLSRSAYRGAVYQGGADVDQLAIEMLGALGGSRLVYGYHPDLDKRGHEFGIDSAPWRVAAAEIDRLLTMLIDGLPRDSALVVTADHGQLDIPAEHRLDLDTDPRLTAGIALVAGEARVRYLHTLPDARDDVIAAWRAVLGEGAWGVSREEAVADGWFGPVSEAHLARVGDVVAVCRDDWVVLASEHEPAHVSKFVAYHGSNTAAEMAIPLLVVRR